VRYSLTVELTFFLLNRGLLLDRDAIERLKIYTGRVCEDFESRLLSLVAEGDQVTLLIEYPPKHSVAGLVDSLKGVSSRLLQEARPDLRQPEGALWSPSYNAMSREAK
jgi:putative transposase